MPLTRLDNLISSKTGRYLYVSPDDFNASDALDNRGNSPTRPFLTIQRAFLEVARYSYAPKGVENDPDNDRFDQFSIMLAPGNHYIDNRPGEVTADNIPVFNYFNGEWSDTSILDLSNPNNILYKFNSVEGGAIIPRGTSLVGTDLRRTQIRPLYVPDPADKDISRTSLFQVTGGCYFWQFTIMDGDTTKNSPLYDGINKVGKVYSQPSNTLTTIPLYSHHKITNFIFARKQDLGLLYQKIAKAFSAYQPEIDDPGEFAPRIQENRIVGPLTDSNQIESLTATNITIGTASYVKITVQTKVDHLFFVNQAVAVTNVGINEKLNGVFYVYEISTTDRRQFSYLVDGTAAGVSMTPGAAITNPTLLNKPGTLASVQAEVDSVESASPYVFNVSIRSTWGICGIWADGSRASGFKSMVIAQYTGVSLQKDDRAFIRYDEFTNTWNQANLQDAFSTTPYHIDGTAYWKDDWRNFHVRASEDSFIQCVSIFAVGFADHFLMESGGDMSITNSNSNFGNTSLHTIGYKGFAFNQDKGGYISHIIPPKKIDSTDLKEVFYYPFNLQLTRQVANAYRIYLSAPTSNDPNSRPSSSIDGNKVGGKAGETISVKMDAIANESGKQLKTSLISPNGIKKWTATLSTLSPAASGIDNLAQDAANLIDANKTFIQEEAFGYILQKYPNLQNIPYVNPNITNETGRYRDASNLIKANRQEIIDTAFADMVAQFPTFIIPGNTSAGNQINGAGTTKCKRDIGYIVDAVANDLYSGGNSNIVDATKAYFTNSGAPINGGLVGEESQSVYAFGRAGIYMKQALTNQLTIKDLTVIGDPQVGGSNTDPNSCANVRATVDTLISIINTSVTAGNLNSLPNRNLGPWSSVSENSKCKRDIGYIVEAITSDLRLGGNQNIVNAAQAYYTGTSSYTLSGTISTSGVITGISSTAGLVSGMSLTKNSGTGNFGNNPTIQTVNSATQITVVNSSGTFTAGSINFTASSLDYIQSEKIETLDAFQYVRDLAIAAMRNWSFIRQNCVTSVATGNTVIGGVSYPTNSIVNVGDTVGIVVGMQVTGSGMPASGAYVKRILSGTQIQLGTSSSKLGIGNSVSAANAQSNTTLTFTLNQGAWAIATEPTVDNSILTTNAGYPECQSVASAIGTYYNILYTIINTPNGINSVTVNSPSSANNSLFAQRATLFKLNEIGTGANTNPHNLETGTPVRLVPRAIDSTIDKRLVRLPKGFDTNTKYYVIAPGRVTSPYSYTDDSNSAFNDPQALMLATSQENANAGIYIYSSETSSIAPGVKIEVHQYIKDTNYDLHKFKANLIKNNTTTFETEGPHCFDFIFNYVTDDAQGETWLPQKIFFRVGTDISGSVLPSLAPASGTGTIKENKEYYVRYVKPTAAGENNKFTIHTSLVGARNGTNPVTFIANSSDNPPQFYVYANKRTSPLKFDPELIPKPLPSDIVQIKRSNVSVTDNQGNTTVTKLNQIRVGKLVNNVIVYGKHGLATGDSVLIECSDTTFNALVPVVVSVVNDYTFTYSTPLTTDVGSGNDFVSATGLVTKQTQVNPTPVGGCWYLRSTPSNNAIYDRTVLTTTTTSSDTYFTRVDDSRSVEDKIYRLRYVIPKTGNYRDPINGFVLKIRTDDTRRLLPQKILLKPVGDSSIPTFPTVFSFNPSLQGSPSTAERLGLSKEELNASGVTSTFDPYGNTNVLVFDSTDSATNYNDTSANVSFKVQSAKKVQVPGTGTNTTTNPAKYWLELTVFDIGITNTALKNKVFTTLKLSEPQGGNNGNFTEGQTITWSGYSSGSATVHKWFQNTNYLIIKDATTPVQFSAFQDTVFSQGTGTATRTAVLQEKPDGGRSDRSEYLYTTEGASVYTMTPGDTINLPVGAGTNADYVIDSVTDVEDLENTYYIFKSQTIKKRVKGQQDGVYYLTCIRGDIRPYPTGSGIGENFRNFKFSQPVSRVYPQNYKNDPLWFQVTDNVTNSDNPSRDTTIQDPTPTTSSADNYVHGYVTVSDARESVTKEAILDFVVDPGTGQHIFSGETAITAQEGGASAGAESRKISVSGSSIFPTQERLYVELRRPSIARSGNHTFEYLGFGPGNYSTGFPARQQVVLTDIQDFYAQAKKQDAGIVLYTGLNSSGDLYIGNRKINAITGEETLLDAPILDEDSEDLNLVGSLVTTFDDPVTFNNTVLFLKSPVANEYSISFQTPIVIDFGSLDSIGQILKPPITIVTGTNVPVSGHPDSDRAIKNGFGDMTFGNNIMRAGVWKINPRGAQNYSIRTATDNALPGQEGGMLDYPSTGNATSLSLFTGQNLLFSSTSTIWSADTPPRSGDILYKGNKTSYSGSVGWILANDFLSLTIGQSINDNAISEIRTYAGYRIIKVTWRTGTSNSTFGVSSTSTFRFTGFGGSYSGLNTGSNGFWSMPASVNIPVAVGGSGTNELRDNFSASGSTYIYLQISDLQTVGQIINATTLNSGQKIEKSQEIWKETGVIGSESIRTETSQWGNFKLGVNTLARAPHSAFSNAFVDSLTTDPRANLDIVGTAFISGKTIRDYLSTGGGGKPNQSGSSVTISASSASGTGTVATLTFTNQGSAPYSNGQTIIVRGAVPDAYNGIHVVTGCTATTVSYNSAATGTLTNNASITLGKVQTNENNAFIVGGDSINPDNSATLRVATTNNGRVGINVTNTLLDRTLVVGGNGRITGDFRFESDIEVNGGDITTTSATFNIANQTNALTFSAGANATSANLFNNTTTSQTINIGTSVAQSAQLNIHTTPYNSIVNVGTADNTIDPATPNTPPTSLITLGGAFVNQPQSIFRVKNYQSIFDGIVEIKGDQIFATTPTGIMTMFPTNLNTIRIAPTAGTVEIGGVAGTTTLRNGLRVLNKATFESDVEQNGGFRNSGVGVVRNVFGTIRIASVSRTGTTATITTTAAHSLTTGQQVEIACSNETFNSIGLTTVTVTGTTTFTYTTAASGNVSTVASTGTVILPNVGKSHAQGDLTNLNVDYYASVPNFAQVLSITALLGITSPVASTKILTSGNYFVPGNPVRFVSLGNITGINISTIYYVVESDAAGFTISTTSGGSPIVINLATGATGPGGAQITLDKTAIDTQGSQYLSATTTTLPINNPSNIGINQFYLVGGIEIVKTTNLPTISYPYSVEVLRGQEGTAAVAHGDNSQIIKLDRTENASFIFPSAIDGVSTTVNLAEFSGTFAINDLLRIDRGTSSDEYVKISVINESDAQTFSINNGASGTNKLTTFNVVTTSGNTDIRGDVTIGFDNGTTSSTSSVSGTTIISGGGNLKVHNSIELSGNSATTLPEKQYFVITNGSAPKLYVETATGNTRLYNGANFQIFKDSFFASGTFDKLKVDGATDIAFEVLGQTGNSKISGTLNVGNDFTIENNLGGTDTFTVDAQTGDTYIGRHLTINGASASSPSAGTITLAVNGIGVSGNKPFKIKQDASIDAFGRNNFYNKNGGRRTIMINQTGGTLTAALETNTQYLVRPTSNLILNLPTTAETGDIIRFVDVQGALNYNISLQVRAPVGTAIQGSTSGSGGYAGGELIVNTPNAGFALIFVGIEDSDGNGTPDVNRGWWLVEV